MRNLSTRNETDTKPRSSAWRLAMPLPPPSRRTRRAATQDARQERDEYGCFCRQRQRGLESGGRVVHWIAPLLLSPSSRRRRGGPLRGPGVPSTGASGCVARALVFVDSVRGEVLPPARCVWGRKCGSGVPAAPRHDFIVSARIRYSCAFYSIFLRFRVSVYLLLPCCHVPLLCSLYYPFSVSFEEVYGPEKSCD